MNNRSIQWKNIRFAPILHNRMEFALEVKREFEAYGPDILAVEYPNTLKDSILQGVDRLPLLSVVYYQETDGAFTYLLLEPTDGQVEAIRLARAKKIPVYFIDRDEEKYPLDLSPMPDPYSVARIGLSNYCRAYMQMSVDRRIPSEDLLRVKTMSYHLQNLSQKGERILFVGGLTHIPGLLSLLNQPQVQVMGRMQRKGVGLAHLHIDSSREILTETPFLAAAYEHARKAHGLENPDRLQINHDLIHEAKKTHWKNSKEKLSINQMKVLNRFARNYALLTGHLAPDFYQLVVAARGAADDNFAYEVWEKGSEYPWQTEEPGLPVLHLTGEDLFLNQKKIRFHRRLKSMRRRLMPVPVRKKKRERYPGEWREEFKENSICSYPPEDVVIEGYGQYLKKRALEIKSEENSRIMPFTCSIEDGLDIRSTIRDLVHKRVYIKEERPLRGKVGSVVMIFSSDYPNKTGQEEFPWRVTWLGEHSQESDMAFYSTPAGEVMDGPGISRCQYGGFMLTYPPMRVFDIWRDSFFDLARNKPERLLMAALDYSLEKHVVYVAEAPPSGWCKSLAARLGKAIIYLPIGTFSPVTLKKIRRFHVLDGHPVRKHAHHYIS